MSGERQDELGQLAERLVAEKRLEFSFLPTDAGQREVAVSVRECDEADFVEYGEKYEAATMFEIGPPLSGQALTETKLRFSTMQEAGDAVLQRRAAILGVPWGDA
jgi:hypothetical protein